MTDVLQPAREIHLQIGPHAVTLRASLRAAVALEAMPGGLTSVWAGVASQKLTALQAVVRLSSTDRREAEALLNHTASLPLVWFIGQVQAACVELLISLLAPATGEDRPAKVPQAEPMPLGWFFAALYRQATSWLHWPPSEIWNASVSEITAALEARAGRELGLSGKVAVDPAAKAAQRAENEAAGLDPDLDRAGLARLKAMR